MSTIQGKLQLIRRFVCATCLSRDRKMFPVSVEMIRCGLNVQACDFVCWECCYFLFKVMAFRRRAKRAQVVLNEWANGKVNKLDSLSSLGESTGLVLDIPHVPAEDKHTFSTFDDGDEPNFEAADTEPINGEEFEAPKKKGKKRKTEPKKTAEVKEYKPFYDEVVMTEEQMLEWRKRKKDSVIYTSILPTYRCENCLEGFDRKNELNHHMKKHSEAWGTLVCVICEQRRESEIVLNMHTATHYRLFTCQLCGLEWDDVNVMREHGAAEHGRPVEYRRCAHCFKEINDRFRFVRHLRCHRRQVLKSHLSRAQAVGYQCDYCKEVFTRKKTLTYHITLKHGGEETCNICKKVLENKLKMRNHMRNAHGPRGPPAICDQCGKSYTNMKILVDHINTHTGARPYACTRCDAKFAYSSCLYLHGRYKHNINKKPERKQEKKKKK